MENITLRGVRTHNLKNIDLSIPRDKMTVITGLSGSGKSSLAFDTLYAEGQRRYVESLSTYARQFLSLMEKPDVDHIEGLSPAISIEQKTTSHNPRSTVGTITEIYDYLRLLFARVGQPQCPQHHISLEAQTISQMLDQLLMAPADSKWMILAPIIRDRKGEHIQLLGRLATQGFVRVKIDGILYDIHELPTLNPKQKHNIQVVIDRFKVRPENRQRLAESLETALALSDGIAIAECLDAPYTELIFSAKYACPHCGHTVSELEPKLFSFNNPTGACPDCDGLGVQQFFDPARIVHQPSLSLPAGAIRGWDRRNSYYFHFLTSLAEHYKFDINTPFNELPQKTQQIILNGSGSETLDFQHTNEKGHLSIRNHTFEGVLPNFERRYKETESEFIREELSKFIAQQSCKSCHGTRLREEARHVYINETNLPTITALSIGNAFLFFQTLKLVGKRAQIADKILSEISQRLQFLLDVGLDYLTLNRTAETLSGGEAQRIRLASQIGAGLVGVLYILDEPSIGLHQRDNARLLQTLRHLRDIGNTVIVVEHDEDAILSADYVVDIGPGAGIHGGQVVAQGTPAEIMANPNSITGQYLSHKKTIAVPSARLPRNLERVLKIQKASGHNLKEVSITIPLGLMTCITGVSGSGKSTLINHTLYPHAAHLLNRANLDKVEPCEAITGFELLDKVVGIDQSPIGRTPRSNPATYTGLLTPIREILAQTSEARIRGYQPGRFSFNVRGGRCEACEGDGLIRVEMHFLADVYVSCDICHGKRYNEETLQIHYKGKNIHEILNMTVEEALPFFDAIPALKRKLQTLMDVGLSYITLGQSATTLSGGEAQRIKLAKELSRRDTGNTLYILDEPTTGLHFQDVQNLLDVLTALRDRGNTIIIIEHNLDVIKTADWIIDLGPEGGDRGGMVIAEGPPEEVAQALNSYTGHFLEPLLRR